MYRNEVFDFTDYYGNHLFRNVLLSNELNHICVSLVDNKVIFKKEENSDDRPEKETDNFGITDLTKIKNKLDQLIDKVDFLELKVLEFEGMIANNECEIDDVRCQVEDFNCTLEDIKSILEDTK